MLPILLLTGFALYVIWEDATATQPVSELNLVIDAVIVGLAIWSWVSFLREKAPKE
jgi:hypothetical protein